MPNHYPELYLNKREDGIRIGPCFGRQCEKLSEIKPPLIITLLIQSKKSCEIVDTEYETKPDLFFAKTNTFELGCCQKERKKKLKGHVTLDTYVCNNYNEL